MSDGWHTPAGYPAGIKQKILASDLDETKKMGSRSHWGGILLSLFSRDNLTSVLSLVLAGAVLLYTIPVPLAAQMPTLPTIPIKPPAAGGKGAGGGEGTRDRRDVSGRRGHGSASLPGVVWGDRPAGNMALDRQDAIARG